MQPVLLSQVLLGLPLPQAEEACPCSTPFSISDFQTDPGRSQLVGSHTPRRRLDFLQVKSRFYAKKLCYLSQSISLSNVRSLDTFGYETIETGVGSSALVRALLATAHKKQ